jgi:hypothetical protein
VDRDIGIVPQPGGDSNSWPEIGYKNAAKTAFIAVSGAVREASISVFFIRGAVSFASRNGRQATARPIYETLPPLSFFRNFGSHARLTGLVHGASRLLFVEDETPLEQRVLDSVIRWPEMPQHRHGRAAEEPHDAFEEWIDLPLPSGLPRRAVSGRRATPRSNRTRRGVASTL